MAKSKKIDENVVAQNVKEIIEKLGVSATAEVSKENNTFLVEISSSDSSLLIGKHGVNLESLQFVLAVRLKSLTGNDDFELYLDIDNWRKVREEKLVQMAKSLAEKVSANNREEELFNLTPSERRVIHTTLSNHPKVSTISEGEGIGRHIIIKPKNGKI